jgi:hypothetical protein
MLREDSRLEVAVRNISERRQIVRLRVVDLRSATGKTDAVIAHLFDPRGVTAAIDAGDEHILTLPVTLPADAKPASGSYTGVLIAGGERGDFARRELTIQVTDAEPPRDQGARLAADGLADLTMPATNFVPSILTPLGPALFVFGVIALLVTLVFWGSLGTPSRLLAIAGAVALGVAAYVLDTFGTNPSSGALRLVQYGLLLVGAVVVLVGLAASVGRLSPVLVGVGAAVLIAAAVVETSHERLEGRPAAHLIASKSLPVAPNQSTGTVGVVLTKDGDIAELNATGTELSAHGLDRAGAYAGKVDLSRGVEGGDATATVNVRDWWPWALMTIALGVGLGYLLRRYFEKSRPRLLAERDANREWQRISDADSHWQYTAAGRAYATYTWIPLAQAWRAEIDRLLDEEKAEDASKQIEALRTHAQAFEHLRSELIALDAAAAKLGELWSQHRFGITGREQVDPLRLADELLAGGATFGSSADVPKATDNLKERRDEIAKQTELSAEARRILADVVAHNDLAHRLKEGRRDKQKLETIITELAKVARQVLHVKELAHVVEAEKALEVQGDELEKIANAPEDGTPIAEELLESLPAGRVVDVSGLRTFRLMRNLKIPEPTPATEIVCLRYSTTASATACRGDLDDLFELTARISGAGETTSCRVEWDFGNGSERLSQIVALTNGAGEAIARHQFATGGRRLVRLRLKGKEISSQQIELSEAGLAARSRARFAVRDREMTLLAGLIAVGSGMLVLYFPEVAWGQPKDYLQALLWGAVVAEGVKLAGALASRAWPGS